MNTHKSILTTFLAISTIWSLAQNSCDCCSYTALQNRSVYETILLPSLIKKRGIHEIVVYTQAESKYKETKFKFDMNGQITSRIWYNRMGKPHSIYEYERNAAGKVTKETFSYLDSLENKSTGFFSSKITDFSYDEKNRMVKSKERDEDGKVIDDSRANFTKYVYDAQGRVIKETSQYYFYVNAPETSQYITTFVYKDNEFISEAKTYKNNNLFLTSQISYNKSWKPLSEDDFNNLTNEVASQTTYKYDSLDRLIEYITKAGKGSASECPDGGTYMEKYIFDKEGLIEKIIHAYDNIKCIMTIEYR